MTNTDLIQIALQLIGVIPEGKTPDADEAAVALTVCNEIADDWAENGVSINWSEQTSTTADCTLQGAEKSAMQYELAMRLCPIYGRDPSQSLGMLAGSSYRRILRSSILLSMEPIEASMPQSEGFKGFIDITQ